MTNKLFKDISASSVQIVVNHVLSLTVFLITSFYLSKESYGELNWSIAVLMFVTTVLSLRLEQIVVKKTAAGQDASDMMSLFMMHVFLSGTLFYTLLLIISFIFPSFFGIHSLLLIIGISQLLSFFSSPFKQIANGKERYDYLAIMSSTGNMLRVVGLFFVISLFHLTIRHVLIIFIISSFIELIISFFIATRLMKISISKKIKFNNYKALLNESLPQIGSAIFMAGISRMDWIILGVFSTASFTAEYSFAYRVYEFSPIPLLIIAPVLLSRFSKYLASNPLLSLLQKKKELSLLIRSEMVAATLIPLVLNIIWSPLIDTITQNKYGFVNQYTFFILSCCLPFQYISNLIWSAHLAQQGLKKIFRITLITFLIILLGDLLFIPLYNAKAAATVYLIAMIIEYINYMRSSEFSKIRETWLSLLICLAITMVSGFLAFYFFDKLALRLGFAISLYLLLLLATRQLKTSDINYVFQGVKPKND